MKFSTTFLSSRVARRVFILFILCALIPISSLAVISFVHVTNQLYEQSQKRLRQASKAVGMAIYERLLFLEAELDLIASRTVASPVASSQSQLEDLQTDLSERFTGLALVTDPGRSVHLWGEIQSPPAPSPAEEQHLRSGKTLVSSDHRRGSPSRLFMSRTLDPLRPEQGVLLAEVNGNYLWGIGEEGGLPPMTDMCVFEESAIALACSSPAPVSLSEQVAQRLSHSRASSFEWKDGGNEYLVGMWTLPLKFRFFPPSWIVVLSEAKTGALAPLNSFKYTFTLVMLLSLSVVSLLSLKQIRSSLVPLEKLQEGTRRIAMRDFSSRVTLTTGDEFEELAASFNAMAVQLGRQFTALAAIGEIGRAVLSALDPNRIVDSVLARMRGVFPCECVSVTVKDADTTGTAWMFYKDGDAQKETQVERLELTGEDVQTLQNHADRLALTGTDIPRFLTPLATCSATTFLVLPLFHSQRLLGFIALGYRDTPEYSQDDLAQMRQLADQVAVALANAHDLAERKRTEALLQESNRRLQQALDELKETHKQMIQQERLRALGQMASGIAHDFNNTLTPIVGFSELLLMDPKAIEDQELIKERLQIINMAARDATKVVSRLREFYRPRVEDDLVGAVNLNQLIGHTIQLTQPKWKDQALASAITVQINTNLQEVSPVAGNESELREVVTNLILNAVDALVKSGTITITTRPEGEHIILEVSDTGVGMTEEVRQRCLEPFFSTKGDRGTGLGLSMVYGIIRRHGGTIDIQSETGKGTTFSIRLPVQKEQECKSPRQEETKLSTRLHVLVVDDDALVRKVTTEYLRSAGHTVETANNGAEALGKFNASRFHLVVTDQGMPEMSGVQLAAAIKKVAPQTPIVLLTGVATGPGEADEANGSVDFTVSKPLTMTTLQQVLAKVKAQEKLPQSIPGGIANSK